MAEILGDPFDVSEGSPTLHQMRQRVVAQTIARPCAEFCVFV